MTPARKKAIVDHLDYFRRIGRSLPEVDMLREAMADLEIAENQVAELGRENTELKGRQLAMAKDQDRLSSERDKLLVELTELQLMSVRDGTVRFGPTGSEEQGAARPRGRKWRR